MNSLRHDLVTAGFHATEQPAESTALVTPEIVIQGEIVTDRIERDGMIAVLYSPGYGAGWSTWMEDSMVERALYCPRLVQFILENEGKYTPQRHAKMEAICKEEFGEDAYFGGLNQLEVDWVPKGTQFYIKAYDGSECIVQRDNMHWHTA